MKTMNFIEAFNSKKAFIVIYSDGMIDAHRFCFNNMCFLSGEGRHGLSFDTCNMDLLINASFTRNVEMDNNKINAILKKYNYFDQDERIIDNFKKDLGF